MTSKYVSTKAEIIGATGVIILIFVVLGELVWSIYSTESGIGALFALILAIIKKTSWSDIGNYFGNWKNFLPILFLLIAAQMYARLLAMGGISEVVQSFFTIFGNDFYTILIIMV